MSVFKRKKGRGGNYYIEVTQGGVVVLPRTSTLQRDKALAKEMEAAVLALYRTGWRDLVDEVRDGRCSLTELWQAKLDGDGALKTLRERRGNPLLADVIADRLPLVTDERIRTGYEQLRSLAPTVESRVAREEGRRSEPVRLSWLLEGKHITALYEAALSRNLSPDTVRRSLKCAVSDLLTRKYGVAKARAAMGDAKKLPKAKERKLWLSTEEINRLLQACDIEFRPVVALAITTGMDRGPMLAAKVHHYDAELGHLSIPDEKTHARYRTLILRDTPLLENAEMWLRELVAGRGPDEPLVNMTKRQLRTRWEAVAKAIGRPDMRWKDNRSVFATYALAAGHALRDVQYIMGHSTPTMTVRYERLLPIGRNRDELRAAARSVGRYRPELKVETA